MGKVLFPIYRSSLSNHIQNDNTSSSFSISALIVKDPRSDVEISREDAGSGKEYAEIAYSDSLDGRKQDISNSTNKGSLL